MNQLTIVQMIILFTLVFLPGPLILFIWLGELKKKRGEERVKKALHITTELTIKKPKKAFDLNTIPDSVIPMLLIVATIFLFIMGFSLPLVSLIDATLFFLLKSLKRVIESYRISKLTEDLPSTIDFLARSIASGNSYIAAIEQAAHANFPASPLFQPIYEALAVGKPFAETLKNAARKINHPDFTLCTAVMIIQQDTGTHDTKAFTNLSALLRHKVALKRKIKAGSAEARLSGYLIAFLPLLSLMFLGFTTPDYIAPVFYSPLGQYLLTAAMCSNIVGLIIMKKMTQIEL